ncbi:MAG: hypothetical protein IJ391_07270 [Clostridia bacterium]|nr:hypothetical protein [Clostridia bacterium]
METAYKQLATLYEIAKKVTLINDSPRAKAMRTLQLEKIVEKIVLHVRSMLLLIDGNRGRFEEMDVALVASAARNIIDSTNLYFHIAERGLSEDEKQLRFWTMYINGQCNTRDITQKLGFPEDCQRAGFEKFCRNRIREEIKHLPPFAALTADEQAQILSGRKAVFRMRSPGILDTATESAVFNLLSNSTHGMFIGLGNNSINDTHIFSSFFGAAHLMSISLLIARLYTARVIKDYIALRKQLNRLLTADDKQRLKEYCLSDDLNTCLKQMSDEYESSPF